MFRRIGEGTDVVRKEMYDFLDKGGRHIALRPEGTASVVRAFVAAPARRRRGRSGTPRRASATSAPRPTATASTTSSAPRRIGPADPDLDVEVIAMLHDFYRSLGLAPGRPGHQLDRHARRPRRATSTGCARSSSAASASSTPTTRRRSRPTPCGCSTPSARAQPGRRGRRAPAARQPVARGRARTSTGCSGASTALGIPFRIEPRLVRGLDYYTHTTFEFQSAEPSTPRRTPSVAAVATTVWSSRSAGRRRPASVSAPGIERVLLTLRRGGRVPGARAAASTCSSST